MMHTIHGKKLLMLRPGQIRLSAERPIRKTDLAELKPLAESIAENGVIEPIAVRKSQDGFYILIAGERRLRAAVMAGLRRIPCVLHKIDNNLSIVYSLTENLQRTAPYFLDEATAFERIIKAQGVTVSRLARSLGIQEAYIHSRLQLTKLSPEIRCRIEYADLQEEYAKLLLLLPEYQRPEILSEIITDCLSLADAAQLVNSKINPQPLSDKKEKPPVAFEIKPIRKSSIGDLRLFGNSLNKLVDTLKNSGISAAVKKVENSKYIEYKVKIKKDTPEITECTQLKLSSV